jgi:transcriptional regulator with XRE-family HTH domain
MKDFGNNLTTARLNIGFTQGQLAQATGLHQSVISAIENGKRLPTIPQWLQLAGVLNVSLQWFLTGTNTVGFELPDLAPHLAQLGIADLHIENKRVPGAFRHDAETIVLALSGYAPSPRILEAIPAVLAWNPISPIHLLTFADLYDRRILYRLAWLADIALTLNQGRAFPGGCVNLWSLEHLVREVPRPTDEDSLGFASSESERPPVTLRWKIGYPAPLAAFRERAERLHALRTAKSLRVSRIE